MKVHCTRYVVVLVLGLMSIALVFGHASSRIQLTAPTYYLAAEVNDCESEPNSVRFRGVTNLPVGALITADVTEFESDAWKEVGESIAVPVWDGGAFSGEIIPRKGMRLGRNQILRLDFMPYSPKQPPSVLAIVGKKGENLRGMSGVPAEEFVSNPINPQLFQVSGWNYGLETIARVPNCGER